MEELKEQAHKEFDEMKKGFIAVNQNEWWSSDEDCIKSFISSLIDKTVQHERERIVGLIDKLRRTEPLYIGETQYRFDEGNVDWVYNGALDDLLSLITNKRDINKEK